MLDPRSGDGADDLLGYRARHLSFTFTNRCNLRCVYCPQGTHPDEFHADSPDEQLRKIVAYIEQHGIERVSLGYYGETMMIDGWEAYCRPLLDRGIFITLVSNFSKYMTPSELDVVSRFNEIQISIDSVDPKILKRVRKALDVRMIVYNTQQIQAHVIANDLAMPRLIWTGVLTDQVVMGMRDLVAMAIANGLKHINYNDVSYFETAKNTTRNVCDMPADEFLAAVAVIEESRRLAARHGVEFTIASDGHIEQRLLNDFGVETHQRLTKRLSGLDMLSGEGRIYIYGAGEAGRALRRQIATRSNLGFAGYIDSFKDGTVEGAAMLSLDAYRDQAQPGDQILICSMYEDTIEATLSKAGFTNYLKAYSFFKRNFISRLATRASADPVVRSGIQGKFIFAGEAFDGVPEGMTRMCDSPWTEIYFDPKGEAYSCCQRGTIMGMLTPETSVDAIRNNDSYRKLRQQILTGIDLDPECARCESRRIVPPEQMVATIDALLSTRE